MTTDVSVEVNPLLSTVAPWITRADWHRYLYFNPLIGVNWRGIRPPQREFLLARYKLFHFPSHEATCIASALQADVFFALEARDLRNPQTVAASNRFTISAGLPVAHENSLFHAAGGAIAMGDTGLGKTSSIYAALRGVFPRQCIDHGSSLERYGIARLFQISYLVIDFNEDGSAWGLVSSICSAIDDIAGTNHAKTVSKCRNAEIALDDVIRILKAHHVFVIVFDELQENSLKRRGRAPDLVGYFKKLMNNGISVVLSGHPQAFPLVQKKAQLMRRFSAMGVHRFKRASSSEDNRWLDSVEGMMTFRLVEDVHNPPEVMNALCQLSGLTQAYMSQLWVEAQRVALVRGGESARLTVEDVKTAFVSEEYAATAEVIRNLPSSIGAASPFEDITPEPPALGSREDLADLPSTPPSKKLDVVPKQVKDLSRAAKKAEAKRLRDAQAMRDAEALDDDDLRRNFGSHLDETSFGLGPQGILEI